MFGRVVKFIVFSFLLALETMSSVAHVTPATAWAPPTSDENIAIISAMRDLAAETAWATERGGVSLRELLQDHYDRGPHTKDLMFWSLALASSTPVADYTPALVWMPTLSRRFISALLTQVLTDNGIMGVASAAPPQPPRTTRFAPSRPGSSMPTSGAPASAPPPILPGVQVRFPGTITASPPPTGHNPAIILDVSLPVTPAQITAASSALGLLHPPLFLVGSQPPVGAAAANPPRIGEIGHIRIYITRNPATGELGRIATVFLSE